MKICICGKIATIVCGLNLVQSFVSSNELLYLTSFQDVHRSCGVWNKEAFGDRRHVAKRISR